MVACTARSAIAVVRARPALLVRIRINIHARRFAALAALAARLHALTNVARSRTRAARGVVCLACQIMLASQQSAAWF